MKAIRGTLILCSALALTAGVAMAQGGEAPDGGGRFGGGNQMYGRGPDGRGRPMPGPMMGRMRRPHMHRRMHDPVAQLLQHQTLLHLSVAQVNNIISIDDKLHNDNKPLVERLMAMRSEMRGMHRNWRGRGAGADTSRAAPSSARRDSAMTIMRTIHENVWRATAAADAVLTPEQLTTAGNLDRAGHPGPVMFFRRQGQMPMPAPGGQPRG
jgi:hypothetical protein